MHIIFILYCLYQMITNVFGMYMYVDRCPHLSHWTMRAGVCNMTPNYHCLFDENRYMYTEFCRGMPYFERPGFKAVVLGNLNGRMCDQTRFQPFIFWTNGSSRCTFQKSTCDEEGQIIIDDGTTERDIACRCDYRQGYSFVSQPRNWCSCVPSEEDCSCYLKPCPDGYKINPDYECKPVGSCRNKTRCTELLWPNETTVKPTITTIYETDDFDTNASNGEHNVLMSLFVHSFAMMTGGTLLALAVLVFKNMSDKDGIRVCLLRLQSLYQHKKKQTTSEDSDDIMSVTHVQKLPQDRSTQTDQEDMAVKSDHQLHQNKSTQTVFEETPTSIGIQTSETAGVIGEVLVHHPTVEMSIGVDRMLITQTKMNYLRLVFLIQDVASRAVRKLFDDTFRPGNLQTILNENYIVLERLRQRRIITKIQWDVMFPATGSVISESFDLGLMICLLRNLQHTHSKEQLADLDSLYKCRCLILHSFDYVLTDKVFNEYWNNLSKLIVRVGGEDFATECEDFNSSSKD